MNRKDLVQRIQELKGNYSFVNGFIYRINEYDGDYPLLWCVPPVFQSRTGDNKSFKVTLYAFDEINEETEIEKEQVWSNQEDYLLTIADTIQQLGNDVINVRVESLEVDEYAISNRGTLSSVIVLSIDIYDCGA